MDASVAQISQAASQPISKSANLPNYRLRRAVAGAVIVLLVALVAALFQLQGAQATSSQPQTEFKYISVNAGDSLWKLAEKYAPKADPRDWIDQVVNLNQLASIEVTPGQRIALP